MIARALPLILCLGAVFGQTQKDLTSSIDGLLVKYKLDPSKVGIAIYDTSSGGYLYRRNLTSEFILASNTKLFVTACALARLGPKYQFETILYYRGEISKDGVLKGDLGVVGGGDPNISGRFHGGDPTAIFKAWAEKLKGVGIKIVRGDLVLDDSLFDDQFILPDWRRFDLSRWWVAPVGALSFNDNCVDVVVEGGRVAGKKARIKLSPPTRYVTIINRTEVVTGRSLRPISFDRYRGTNKIVIRGQIKKGRKVLFSVAIKDPCLYFGTVLRETLAQQGITVKGRSLGGRIQPQGWIRLASFSSDLARTITVTNRMSQNFYAEMLVKLLGARFGQKGSTEEGLKVIKGFLEGIGLGHVSLGDGCGLSRSNKAAPGQLVRLLLYMLRHRYSQEFLRSLAISGDNEGSLRKRLRDRYLRGKVMAKTGHIKGVNALSGFIRKGQGVRLIFSILINDPQSTASNGNRFQDEVLRLLVSRDR
jgi:D-alanyl-D-alanine carboxypeptidase/D-alanyl-D-alanine-endopeptidase (penicillin-binding protein 4)